MANYDLVAPCGDYCGGCGQYNGLIVETARQIRELASLYGFEFRSEGGVRFQAFCEGIRMVHREREVSRVPRRWRTAGV